jgi:hypothetical protein
MWRWYKSNIREFWTFGWILLVITLVAAMVTGKLAFPTRADAQSWIGHGVTLVGVALGSGIAIWWSVADRRRVENRKRRAFAVALVHEQNFNHQRAKVVLANPKMPFSFLLGMHDTFESHVELFSDLTVHKVFAYRNALRYLFNVVAPARERSEASMQEARDLLRKVRGDPVMREKLEKVIVDGQASIDRTVITHVRNFDSKRMTLKDFK